MWEKKFSSQDSAVAMSGQLNYAKAPKVLVLFFRYHEKENFTLIQSNGILTLVFSTYKAAFLCLQQFYSRDFCQLKNHFEKLSYFPTESYHWDHIDAVIVCTGNTHCGSDQTNKSVRRAPRSRD